MKKLSLSSVFVATFVVAGVLIAGYSIALAATVFTDDFGTGATDSTVSGWTEGSDGAERRAAGSGNDSASPNGGRFAVIYGDSGYICRTVATTGFTNVQLSYQWRGDSDSSSSGDNAIVEFKTSGSCSDSSGWTQLADHDMQNDSAWSTQAPISNVGLNNASVLLRFRASTNNNDEHFRVDGVNITGDALGSITIVKDSVPNDAQDFAFTTTGTGLSNFSLDDDSNGTLSNTRAFNNLASGTYTVTEAATTGFSLTSLSCSDGSTVDLGSRTATISLAAGENVTCTFTNTKQGTIVIVKDAVPNGAQDFTFSSDFAGIFNLDDDADGTLSNTKTTQVTPGKYAILEQPQAGWVQTSAVCNQGETIEDIDVAAGETVTCTFTNTQQTVDLTVVKTNNLAGANAVSGTPFNWILTATNGGNSTATFTNGQVILTDNLPTTPIYGTPAVGGTATGTVDCTISSNNLVCVANGTVTIPASGTLTVTTSVIPNTYGTLANPRAGGVCNVDSNGVVTETNEGNNTCSNSVTVRQANPSLGGACGLDIALVLDSSGSIDAGELATMKTAFNDFVGVFLPGTPTLFSVTDFDDDGLVLQGFTNNTGLLTTAINTPTSGGSTNWQDGLADAYGTFDPRGGVQNVIVFASDGNPTEPGTDANALAVAIDQANIIKAAGTKIIALGMGADVNTANLESISGAGDVYTTANFGELADALNDLAIDLCGGTVSVHKIIDADGNLGTTGDQTNGSGWTFNTNVDAPDTSTPPSGVTDVNGTFNFEINLGANDLATTDISEVLQPGYTNLASSCVTDGNVPIGTPGAGSVADITLSNADIVSCTFINASIGTIVVDKVTVPSGSAQSFSFDAVGGSYADFALTDAATPNSQTLASGTYSVSETIPSGWLLETPPTCVSSLGDTESPASLELDGGETITCTFTNAQENDLVAVKTNNSNGIALNGVGFNWEIVVNNLGPGSAVFFNAEDIIEDHLPTGATYGTPTAVVGAGTTGTVNCAIASNTLDCDASGTVVIPTGGTITITVPVTPTVAGSLVNPTGGVCAVDPDNIVVENIGGNNGCGDTVVVEEPATLIIVKDTVPNNAQDFSFVTTGQGLSNFNLDDDADGTLSNTQTFTNLYSSNNVGLYSVVETAVPGFASTVVCDDTSPAGAINLTAGETVTCTFTNTQKGHIVIVKDAVPNDAQDFSFATDYASVFALDDDADGTLSNTNDTEVVVGSYTILEGAEAGWDLTNLVCDDANSIENVAGRTATINVEAGETVTCTFTNTKKGHLIVQKTTYPAAEITSFPINASGTGVVTGGGAGSVTDAVDYDYEVTPGTYSVTEDLANLPKWMVVTNGCSNIVVDPGETETCEIVNKKAATVQIIKTSIGGVGQFDFTGDVGPFSLTTTAPNTPVDSFFDIFVAVNGQPLSITETVPSGWNVDQVTCNLATVFPGATPTCTFVNTAQGHLVVHKITDPVSADPTIFEVTASGTGTVVSTPTQNFDVGGVVDYTVTPGTYSVTETAEAGWDEINNTCVGVVVAPGATEHCNITNQQDANIVIKKETNPEGDVATFEFDPSWSVTNFSLSDNGSADSGDIVPGTYSVVENTPAGWDLMSAVCDDGSLVSAISLQAGETVTCTFTNEKDAFIVVDKVTLPALSATEFDFTSSYGSPFTLTDAGTPNNSGDLAPGTYSVSEGVEAGWDLTNTSCVSSNGDEETIGTISLQAGETVTCTFTNTQRGSITVIKDVINPDGGVVSDNYVFEVKLDNANGQPLAEGTNASYTNLVPGSYTISETADVNYDLNAPVVVTLAPGENEVITLTNKQKKATLTITKNVVKPDGTTEVVDLHPFTVDVGGTDQTFGETDPAVYTLNPGIYTVTEETDPNYDLVSILNDEDLDTEGVQAVLGSNGNVGMTITNKQQNATITVIKDVVNPQGNPVDDATVFTIDVGGEQQTFSEGDPAVFTVVPGTYGVSELLNANYDQPVAQETTVTSGQDIEITITNQQKSATITVKKDVVGPSNEDVADAHLFHVVVNSETKDLAEGTDAVFTVNPGTYPVIETPDGAYDLGTVSDVVVTSNDSQTVTLINKQKKATITLVKVLPNDDGGEATQADFTVTLDGAPAVWGANNVAPGTYTLNESTLPGYTPSGWTCQTDSVPIPMTEVTVTSNSLVTCTITNDDVAPKLTVIKNVINDNGGTAVAANFSLIVNTDGFKNPAGQFPGSETGTVVTLEAGEAYGVAESVAPGYGIPSFSEFCTGTLSVGEEKTCTVTNDDDAPSLILVKNVVNDNGGTADATAWTLTADGPTDISGLGGATSTPTFFAGTYTLSESDGPAGYIQMNEWSCTNGVVVNENNQITLALGQSTVCTVTNDDQNPRLVLNKVVVNDNGGEADADEWTLTADGPTPLSGLGGDTNADVVSDPTFSAGVYNLSESVGPAGYTAGEWSCVINAGEPVFGSQIELGLADVAVCTIVNNDDEGSLTLVKEVIKDNGGTLEASTVTLTATGPTGFSGFGPSLSNAPSFDAGSYDLSESAVPGYTASPWVCVGGNQTDTDTVAVGLGEDVTCTITNNDNVPSLTLIKEVVNDNNGDAEAVDWTLTADGPTDITGQGGATSGSDFDAGTYTLSETGGPTGYTASAWSCTNGVVVNENNQITLALGQSTTCTITNDDQQGTLIVEKVLTQNNGGTESYDDFSFTIDGGEAIPFDVTGTNEIALDAGTYDVEELEFYGYTTTYEGCTDVVVTNGGEATCTITNDDIAPKLKLQKVVVGGPLAANAWNLKATGPTTISANGGVSSGPTFQAGEYTLTETSINAYGIHYTTDNVWSCIGEGNVITLGIGDVVECEITNTHVPPGTIIVEKQTVPDGSSEVFSFTTNYGVPFNLTDGQTNIKAQLVPGTYSVTEAAVEDWDSSAVCSDGSNPASISLQSGEIVTCVFTNTRHTGTIEVVKDWVGTPGSATLSIGTSAGGSEVDSELVTVDGTTGENTVETGTYYVSESGIFTNFNTSLSCSVNGDVVEVGENNSIEVGKDDEVVCTFTNTRKQGTLTVTKVLPNNNGGTAEPQNFSFSVNGGDPIAFEADGTNEIVVETGTFSVVETNPMVGYAVSYANNQNEDTNCTNLSVGEGDGRTCTITNDDEGATLTIVKVVDNGTTGSTNDADDFQMKLDDVNVAQNSPIAVTPGAHTVTETGSDLPNGYVTTYSEECPNGVATLALGESKTCTVTNTAVPPVLIVEKVVSNDDGVGDLGADAFVLRVDGNVVLRNIQNVFTVGEHEVSEDAHSDYTASFDGDCDEEGMVTLALGDVKTCTITNDDNEPTTGTITVTKVVVGTQEFDASDFPLFVGDTEVTSGVETVFEAGSYTVYESSQPNFTTSFSGDCVADENNENRENLIADWNAKKAALQDAIDADENDDDTARLAQIADIDAKILALQNSLSATTDLSVGEDAECTITNTFVPEPEAGAITVCKLALDADGNIITGVAGTTFTIPGFTPAPVTSEGGPAGEIPDSVYDTPLTLNTTVLANSEVNDAECVTYDNLALGGYYYDVEQIAGDGWETPKYNDQFEVSVATVDDFFAYSGELFDGIGPNDILRNQNADGHITLTEGRPVRTLIVLNQLKPATIVATKIVCDDESYLPNLGNSGAEAVMTATTATEFLAEGDNAEHCSLQPWTFEWRTGTGSGDDLNPGDSVGEAGSPWTEFASGTPTPVPAGSFVWVREQFDTDFVPFTGVNTTLDVSAEIYCSTDVLHYDNYEFINPIAVGETYYCVAWNAPIDDVPVDLCLNLEGPQTVVPEGYVLAGEGQCVPVIVNTCPLPSALGDDTEETVNGAPEGEDDLQVILDGTSYTIDVQTNQEQYQLWNVSANSEVVIDSIFIDEFAGNNQVFGYYTDSLMTNFVPVFKTGLVTGFESVPLSTEGPFSINTGEATTIGFAIKTYAGDVLAGTHATESSLNSGSADQVVVYNPASNVYVLGFEDIIGGDMDFNDLVVEVSLSCSLLCEYTPVVTTLVSDTTTLSEGNPTVALTYLHAQWTASIPGATWIWSEEPLTDPVGDVFETFTKTFTIVGTPTGATLMIAADNSYEVSVNGDALCADATEANYNLAGQDVCVIGAEMLDTGPNTLTFTLKNWAQANGTQQSNPAGLLYKLTLNETQCLPPNEEVDVCSNLEGNQAVIPQGYTAGPNNTCVLIPPPPTDVCPNLEGTQAEMPEGYQNVDGQCVLIPICNAELELLSNGSFENNLVTNAGNWDIFASGTPTLDWVIAWFGGSATFGDVNRPEVANLEIQENGLFGFTASVGTQWAELDADWNGHVGGLSGEPGAVSISQDVVTVVGTEYTVSFDFAARPDTVASQNSVEVLADGNVIGTVPATAVTTWTEYSFDFTATDVSTTITLRDVGTPNDSIGTLVDNASVRCVLPTPPVDVCLNLGGIQTFIPEGYVAGANNTCTPVEPPQEGMGTIIIKKVAVNGEGEFAFNTNYSTPFNLEGGEQYSSNEFVGNKTVAEVLTEEQVADGWELTSAVCVSSNEDVELPGNMVLSNGETITCTFTNTFVEEEDEEDSLPQCSDGVDNDNDGNTDYGFDPSCTSPEDNDESDNPNGPQSFGGGGGGGGGGLFFTTSGGGGNGQVFGATTGEVLGESCGLYMDKFMRRGWSGNNIEQVKKLQTFLNKWMNAGLPVTGYFGPMTYNAVNGFQSKYSDEILAPWQLSSPTGIVYHTTLRWINMLECPALSLNIPVLTPWSNSTY